MAKFGLFVTGTFSRKNTSDMRSIGRLRSAPNEQGVTLWKTLISGFRERRLVPTGVAHLVTRAFASYYLLWFNSKIRWIESFGEAGRTGSV